MKRKTDRHENSATDSSADGFAKIEVQEGALWGSQTQRSLLNFDIGRQRFDSVFIDALVHIKRASAKANLAYGALSSEYCVAIQFACDEVLKGKHSDQFPLRVWQTGSGTQTNMNVNEVIASLANRYLMKSRQVQPADTKPAIHPNDHVNMSQSSNDVFPSAMHIVVAQLSHHRLLPAIERLELELAAKQTEFEGIYTVGRTHLMDAIPLGAGAIFSAYCSQLKSAKVAIEESLREVYQLALGGTAVGSGANAPAGFGKQVVALLAKNYQQPFVQNPNLYAGVSGEDALLRFSGATKQLAAALFKITNDFRLLGSGPRCGLNEWILPANEPGSSIMPGKVNPTQCEALSMVCLQVFGNDHTVSLAASNGHLQLNTYRPVIIYNIIESVELLTDAMISFSENCVHNLKLNRTQIGDNMRNGLSIITLLAPTLGYEVAAKIVREADQNNLSLSCAAETLGLYSQIEFESMLAEHLIVDDREGV
jgi:fumarate hydratase, class II